MSGKRLIRTTSVRLPADLALDAELVARIEERRADPEFRKRLQERIEADQEILDRLAK